MQQRSEETHTKLLNTATQLFAQFGYEATGVAEICEAAEVSKGAFYHHFPSKQAMFLELLHLWLENLNQQLSSVRLDSGSVPQAFIEMSAMASSVFQDAQGRLPIFIEFWIQASHDPSIWEATVAPYRQYQSFFATMLRQGIQEGSIKAVDPDATARAIVAMAVGMLLQGLMDPTATQWDEMMQQGMKLILSGIAQEEA